MPEISLQRKLLYFTILFVASILILEVSLHLIYGVLKRRAFPIGAYNETLNRLAEVYEIPTGDDHQGRRTTIEVLHPFLGFVHDPQQTPNTSYLGFPQAEDDPLQKKRGDQTNVLVVGGSFALGVSLFGEKVLETILNEHGIEARILTAAMGGYKQPQQLFTLGHLLTQGAPIDVVVNIDGFNEVALPGADNLPKGVHPFYPRAWYNRTLGPQDQVSLRLTGRASLLRENRQKWARLFRRLPKISIIRNVVWRAYDKTLETRIADLNERLRLPGPEDSKAFLSVGPTFNIADDHQLYLTLADHWKMSSLLMKAMCDAQGIDYLHFLQPNQNFEQGRILKGAEKTIAFRPDHPYRPGAVQGYPRLLDNKTELLDRGVNFHDLTLIYKDIPTPIYKDDCCHPNQLGYEVVAEYVARSIVQAFEAKASL